MESNQKSEMVFVQGMSFRAVPPTAPETVRGSISFKANEMIKFLQENVDEKGWVNIKMMKSKEKQSIYFILDTYKPKKNPEATAEYNDTKYRTEKEKINDEASDRLFNSKLTEKENARLAEVPF